MNRMAPPRHGIPALSALAAALTLFAPAVRADTTVTVSTNATVAAAKRFGLNLGFHTYYDSRLIMKELCFRNPGFEGQIYQSVMRVAAGTPTNCVDDLAFGGWTNDFWNGASFEFIWGAAKGRAGTVADYVRPVPAVSGSTYAFADSGPAPATGDYFVLRKVFESNPETGWWVTSSNVAITAELADLPPGTPGRQALRAASTGSPASFVLASNFDTYPGVNFILLNGQYRVTFKARSAGGTVPMNVLVRRQSTYLNTNIALSTAWTNYALDFTAAETGSASGLAALQFSIFGTFNVLLDDVSFVQTDGDPANPTAFRDAVVEALKLYSPGILRGWQEPQGESLDNQLAPALGRRRAGYSIYGTSQPNLQYGWHEFLELCDHIGAEPWIVVPIVFSTREMSGLIEYLAGATNTTYGAVRAARGRAAPWTDAFPKIHLEFGNESWNGGTYFGGTIVQSAPYGNRADELFAAARATTGFASNRFDLVLGGHSVETYRNMNIHNACTNHDSLTVDGYLAYRVDSYGSNEELFGPLFAQPEEFNRRAHMLTNFLNLAASPHPVPLSIYEVNLHTTTGAITNSQAALDAFTPSAGAGIAVANHMLMMQRYLRIRDQCLFNFGGYTTTPGSGSRIWAVVRDAGVTNRKRPTFLALCMANEAIGDGADILDTAHSGDDPTWVQVGTNYVTVPNAHQVWSYAFAGAAHRALILFNLGRTNAVSVNFAGPNAPFGDVALERLAPAGINDNNEFAENVAVSSQTLTNFESGAPFPLPPHSMTVLRWPFGPVERWRQSHFGSPANAGIAADAADPDGDGLANILEYALGHDPLSSPSRGTPAVVRTADGPSQFLTLVANRDPGAAGITYIAEVSDDLATWFSGPSHVTILDDSPSLLRARDNIPMETAPRRFIRLRITRP